MNSNTVDNSETNGENKATVIDIPKVCVSRVPKSLSYGKAEAFVPHFVGLGPYHQGRSWLTITTDMKKGAARRVLQFEDEFLESCKIYVSDVEAYYHADVLLSTPLLVDGLFLLALLSHWSAPRDHSYFLTGKYGLPRVNAVGVELTIDAIIRDVFMLENQIPTPVLTKINQALNNKKDEIQLDGEADQDEGSFTNNTGEIQENGEAHKDKDSSTKREINDLGSSMQRFCEASSPLVKSEDLKTPQDYNHLLDLMYHLIVPESEYEPKPEGQDDKSKNDGANSKPKIDFLSIVFGIIVLLFLYGIGMTQLPNQQKPETQPQTETETETETETHVDAQEDSKTRCCSKCSSIISRCWYFVLGIVRFLVSICIIILLVVIAIVWCIPSLLKWVFLSLYGLLKYLAAPTKNIVNSVYGTLSSNQSEIQGIRPITLLLGKTKQLCDELGGDSTNSDKDSRPHVTIPSVMELHKAGIRFRPAEGGIRTMNFDMATSQFSLPRIKLDVNSEIIIRNLVAYESLLVDSDKPLIFTRYVEIMRAIIDIPEDVKLLVRENIIVTKLSDAVVADLFNGMSKSIRPTNAKKLEDEIKKLNDKFKDSQKVSKAVNKYSKSAGKFCAVVGALVFLVLTAMQTYCSFNDCSRTSKYGKTPQGGDYNRNNYFISSM